MQTGGLHESRMRRAALAILAFVGCVAACVTCARVRTVESAWGEYIPEGQASWYGPGFHGRMTANGETFDQRALTAAHRTLAFGTMVRVTNTDNGRAVAVRINDRFPNTKGRIIDLSEAAFEKIAPTSQGVASVRLEILGAATNR